MRSLVAAPLTPASFARFGAVIEAGLESAAVNQGRGRRFELALDLAAADVRATRPVAALYSIEASSLPFTVKLIERHPLSPQLFFPNRAGRFLVCVFDAQADGEPDAHAAHAFIGNAAQGIVYRAGVWHGPLVALDAPADFLMQMWQCDGPLDCEERILAESLSIRVAQATFGELAGDLFGADASPLPPGAENVSGRVKQLLKEKLRAKHSR